MSRKDYIAVAKILNSEVQAKRYIEENELERSEGEPRTSMLKEVIAEKNRTIAHITRSFVELFQSDNPTFDASRFEAAVYK